MRFFLVIIILFTTGYGVSGSSFKAASLVGKVKPAHDLDSRKIRAATNCEEAYQETLTSLFEECDNYLTPAGANDVYTNAQLDLFCSDHCTRTLGSVFRDLARFCGDDVSVQTLHVSR